SPPPSPKPPSPARNLACIRLQYNLYAVRNFSETCNNGPGATNMTLYLGILHYTSVAFSQARVINQEWFLAHCWMNSMAYCTSVFYSDFNRALNAVASSAMDIWNKFFPPEPIAACAVSAKNSSAAINWELFVGEGILTGYEGPKPIVNISCASLLVPPPPPPKPPPPPPPPPPLDLTCARDLVSPIMLRNLSMDVNVTGNPALKNTTFACFAFDANPNFDLSSPINKDCNFRNTTTLRGLIFVANQAVMNLIPNWFSVVFRGKPALLEPWASTDALWWGKTPYRANAQSILSISDQSTGLFPTDWDMRTLRNLSAIGRGKICLYFTTANIRKVTADFCFSKNCTVYLYFSSTCCVRHTIPVPGL
ncbi:hypothetical protein Vafri_5418, partial [Volvox africanus]